MQYMVWATLKPGAEAKLQQHAAAFNEHLAQPFRRISLAAVLRNEQRERLGYVVIIEASSFEDASQFLRQSPHQAANLYEKVEVAQLDVQLGSAG